MADEALPEQLGSLNFTDNPHTAALLGKAVPEDLTDELAIRCLVRGIRCHDGFATELRWKPVCASITRALNARDIMSNRVPAMDYPQNIPYCFWHPDVPTEKTLRELLGRYPGLSMKYRVGRACAAGGYTTLYKELDILPDVAVAEEARDNKHNGHEIYDFVMGQPVRYSVMDDYSREVREKPLPRAFLNGDTCVRSALDKRQPLDKDVTKPYFDIAEDWNIGIDGIKIEDRPIPQEIFPLLYSPLPFDLPTVDKDFLILMAAWTGNIDRYTRLRRPHWLKAERAFIIRGIYFDTMFAKWCYAQPGPDFASVRRYVHARFIMNNDLSWVTDDMPDSDLPYYIWFPTKALPETYVELARRVPAMRQAAAHAFIALNDVQRFEDLQPIPDRTLWDDADRHADKSFLEVIVDRADKLGIDMDELLTLVDYREFPKDPDTNLVLNEMYDSWDNRRYPGPGKLYKEITLRHMGYEFEWELLVDPMYHDMMNVLLYISTFPSKHVPDGSEYVDLRTVYDDVAWIENEEDWKTVGLYPTRQPVVGCRGRGSYLAMHRARETRRREREARRCEREARSYKTDSSSASRGSSGRGARGGRGGRVFQSID